MGESKSLSASSNLFEYHGEGNGPGQFANTREGWVLVGYYYHYSDNGGSAFTFIGYDYGQLSESFAVTSVNSTGEESEISNEASATTPVLDAPTDLAAVELPSCPGLDCRNVRNASYPTQTDYSFLVL